MEARARAHEDNLAGGEYRLEPKQKVFLDRSGIDNARGSGCAATWGADNPINTRAPAIAVVRAVLISIPPLFVVTEGNQIGIGHPRANL